MRIKLDENLARTHQRLLVEAGHDVDSVIDEHSGGAADAEVWRLACGGGRLPITLDQDFSDVRRYPPGSHHGILLLRTKHPSRDTVLGILRRVLEQGGLEVFAGCLAVADEARTRVRRQRA